MTTTQHITQAVEDPPAPLSFEHALALNRTVDKRRQAVAHAERSLDEAKARLKAAESSLAHAFAALNDYMAGRADPTLFEAKPAETEAKPVDDMPTDCDPVDLDNDKDLQPADTKATDWRGMEVGTLETYGSKPSLTKLLHAGKLFTLGELNDFLLESDLTKLEGIGAGKAEQIEEAFNACLTSQGVTQNATTAQPADETDGTESE